MISIKGVIGWDVIGTDFADYISRLSGDLDIEIDSPGGYVTDGISIFNALKRYNKGKVNIQVVGQCSSIAAYIMLAGDTLKFEPNSIVVLHNPWTCGCGDYKAFLHEAEILEKMTNLYAGEFVRKGIFDEKTIRSYMDSEKWFIGADDLKLLGDVIERDLPKIEEAEKEARAAAAIENIKAWQQKARKDFKENLDGVAALISEMCNISNQKNISENHSQLDSTQNAEFNGVSVINAGTSTAGTPANAVQPQRKKEREKIMDLKELQTNHPELFAQVVKQGEEKEKSRVNALMEFFNDDKETVIQAIKDGKSIHDDVVFAKLTRAKINANTIKAMEDENPDETTPAEPVHEPEETPEPTEEEKQKEKEAQEDKEVAENLKKMGLA